MIVFKILKWFFLSIISLLIIWAIGRFLFCEPDKSILKITDPLAKEIVDYINKNGRPESLADIPNLSYRVEKCEKISSNESNEKCIIKANKRTIEIDVLYTFDVNTIFAVGIYYEDKSNNVRGNYQFDINKVNKKLYLKHSHIDTVHDSFFCKNGYLKVG